MDHEKVLGEHKFPTYEELKTGLIQLIDEGKISREDAARLLPELCESEDERIRRKMIEHFKSKTKETWCNMPVKDILAWLEKQKDQKPMDDDPLNDPRFIDGFDTGREVQKIFDEPTKWREEDERILKGIIGKIDHDQTYGVSKAEMLSFLKSIRPQPKQEWSKEDEMLRVRTINRLETLNFHGISGKEIRESIDWLKSLRPSWKPSEEQIEALRRAVNKLAKTDIADSVRLSIMCDNLKKL